MSVDSNIANVAMIFPICFRSLTTWQMQTSQPPGCGEIRKAWSSSCGRALMWRWGNPASAERKMSNHLEAVH